MGQLSDYYKAGSVFSTGMGRDRMADFLVMMDQSVCRLHYVTQQFKPINFLLQNFYVWHFETGDGYW